MIQHRAGKSHGNADALSRRGDELCDCYNAGNSLKSLPCGGCKHCKKIEEQWERFTEEVDYVVPLTMRRVIPTQTDCNWVESYEMKSAQAEDEEAQILIDWLNNKKPELGEVQLLSPAMRSYFA